MHHMESFGRSPEEETTGRAKKNEPPPSEIRYYEGGGNLSRLEGKVFDVSDIVTDEKERQALKDRIGELESGVNETIYEVSDDQIAEVVAEYTERDETEEKLAAEFFEKGDKMDEAHRARKDFAEAKAAADKLELPAPEEMSKAVKNNELPEKNKEVLRGKIVTGVKMLAIAEAQLEKMYDGFCESFAADPDTLLQEKSVSKMTALKMGLRSVFRPSYRKTLRAYETKVADVHKLQDELRADKMALTSPAAFADEMNRRLLRTVEASARIASVGVSRKPWQAVEWAGTPSLLTEVTDDEMESAAEEVRAAKMAEISAEAESESKTVEIESPMDTELEMNWEKEGIKMDKAHAEGLDYAEEKEIAEAKRVPTKEEADAFAKRGEITPEMISLAHNRMAEREVDIKIAKSQLDDIEDKMLRKYGLNPATLLKEKTFSKTEAIKTGLRSLFDGGFRKMMNRYENLTLEAGRLQEEQVDDDLLTKDPKAFGTEMSRRTLRAMVVGASASLRSGSPKGTLGVGPTR